MSINDIICQFAPSQMKSHFPFPTRSVAPDGGWSVTELLVVAALLAILAILAFPAYSALRSRSDAAVCVTNLRAIGVAIHAYGNEHNGSMPGPTYNAFSVTGPLVQQLDSYLSGRSYRFGQYHQHWTCPANRELRNGYISYYANSVGPHYFFGYPQMPKTGEVLAPPKQIKIASLPPNEQWLFADLDEWIYAAAAFKKTPWPPFHQGGRNVLYYPGHVKYIKSVRNVRP